LFTENGYQLWSSNVIDLPRSMHYSLVLKPQLSSGEGLWEFPYITGLKQGEGECQHT